MAKAFASVYSMAKEKNVYMRDAAYMVSIDRVDKAIRQRGWL
jgi:glutamate dehydrogenase (NAD(P)+)